MSHPDPQVHSIADLDSAIHVWKLPGINYGASRSALLEWERILSPNERDRASRFHFPMHRDDYIANRGRLRILLAAYLACAPADVKFSYGPQGKPSVLVPAMEGLEFNLSHTDGLAVVAIARGIPLGIDVERVKPIPDLLEIAKHHFAPQEVQDLFSLPISEQTSAFYRCWSAKESFLKGLGDGLGRDLKAFQVSFPSTVSSSLLACEWDPDLCRTWHLKPLQFGPSYIGSLAYRGIVPLGDDVIQVRNLSE